MHTVGCMTAADWLHGQRTDAVKPQRAMPALSRWRLRLAVTAGLGAAGLSRLSGRGAGGVIGGRVVLGVDRSAPRVLAAGRDVVLVSGTNGKTTTTALLSAALGAQGAVATNADGANTAAGLVTALARGNAPTVVLETDEGWLPWAVSNLRPEAAVLLNLSRDQLSRHHEVEKLASSWREAVRKVPVVVANADDTSVVWAALGASRQVWVGAGQLWTQDSIACPRCGRRCRHGPLSWSCSCGFARPEPTWWLDGDDLVSSDVRLPLRLPLPGRFNRANAAMAVASAALLGVPPQQALDQVRAVTAVAGRFAISDLEGRQVRLMLAKNPAGWLETVDLISSGDTPLVLALNARGVDGRDPSWLYDVSFEALAGRRVVVIGERSAELQVRLQMDGVSCVDAGQHVLDALAFMPPGPVDVVANYTAFQTARRELARAAR
jgi:lipid II isoglutaminyl synthase (glutamine-hydrolysing)